MCFILHWQDTKKMRNLLVVPVAHVDQAIPEKKALSY